MNFQDFSLLGLLLSFYSSFAHAEVVDRVEAIINKKAVYKSDVDQFKSLAPLRAKIDPLFASEPLSKKVKPTEAEVIDFLINEMLISDRFPVSDAEVEQEINGIQGNLKIDRAALRAAISREGFKFDDYFKLMRASISKRQLIDREIRNKAAVSDDDIRADYNRTHAGSKSFRGSFKLSLIKVTKSNFKTPALAKAQAQEALDAIKKGEAFEEVAKRMSDDSSQSAGGDLGYLSYGDMSSTLQKEVQKLGPEKTSGIVEDKQGYLILKVGDIKADSDSGLEKEHDIIRGHLMESEFRHQVQLWLERERSKNFVKVNVKP